MGAKKRLTGTALYSAMNAVADAEFEASNPGLGKKVAHFLKDKVYDAQNALTFGTMNHYADDYKSSMTHREYKALKKKAGSLSRADLEKEIANERHNIITEADTGIKAEFSI